MVRLGECLMPVAKSGFPVMEMRAQVRAWCAVCPKKAPGCRKANACIILVGSVINDGRTRL